MQKQEQAVYLLMIFTQHKDLVHLNNSGVKVTQEN